MCFWLRICLEVLTDTEHVNDKPIVKNYTLELRNVKNHKSTCFCCYTFARECLWPCNAFGYHEQDGKCHDFSGHLYMYKT